MALTDVRLRPHQREFVRDRNSPVLVLKGGLRAGKTTAFLYKMVDLGLHNWPVPTLVVEPTYRMLKDTFVETAIREFGKYNVPWSFSASDFVMTVHFPGRDVRLFLRSADRAQRLYGFTAGAAGVDEWETVDERTLVAIRERVTDGVSKHPQFVLVGTPEGYGVGYKWTEKEPLEGLRMITAPTRANIKAVGESYIRHVSGMMSENEAKMRLEGIRMPKEGRVYTRFNRSIHHKPSPTDLRPYARRLQVWADFNVNPMVWALVIVENGADGSPSTVHLVREMHRGPTDTREQAIAMRQLIAEECELSELEVMGLEIPVLCDATGNSAHASTPITSVGILTYNGFRPQFPSTNPRVKDRIASVQLALTLERFHIDCDRAPNVAQSLDAQPYNKNDEPDKEGGLDHGADIVGYGIHQQWPAEGHEANTPLTGSGLRLVGG